MNKLLKNDRYDDALEEGVGVGAGDLGHEQCSKANEELQVCHNVAEETHYRYRIVSFVISRSICWR